MLLPQRTGWARLRCAALLTDKATIIRKTRVSDGAGGFTTVEVSTGPLPCRMQTTSQTTGNKLSNEGLTGNLNLAISTWVCYFAYGITNINQSDLILHNGRRYEVAGTTADRSDSVNVAVLCKRLD